MALTLPRLQIDLSGPEPRVHADPGVLLRPGELTGLITFDQPQPAHPSERCVALAGRRWAVGRRLGDLAFWRMVDEEAVQYLGHPAWLWTRDAWFDPDRPPDRPGPTPPALPLRVVISSAVPAAGSVHQLARALGAGVGAWRRYQAGEGPPVALVLPAEARYPEHTAARSLALSFLRCLPPDQRERVRVAVGASAPEAGQLDLVICAAAPQGFAAIDLTDPPEDEDLVAFFVEDRLRAADFKAVEAVAVAGASLDGDGWSEAVRAQLRDGPDGPVPLSPAAHDEEPDQAIRRLAARIRAGVPLDDALLERLVALTLRTRDPRPWVPLADRPAVSRARAVQALLPHASALAPHGALIRVLGALYPPGAPMDPWLQALTHWFHHGSQAAYALLERTLVEWTRAGSQSRRLALWAEVIRTLSAQGKHVQARRALSSPVCRSLAREGQGEAVAELWHALDPAARTPEALQGLVALLCEAEDVGPAISALFREVADQPELVLATLETWSTHRPTDAGDPLTAMIRTASFLEDWIACADPRARPEAIGRLAAAVHQGPDDPLWPWLADRLAAAMPDEPRHHLLALAHLGPGLPALEPRAQALLPAILHDATFPDPALAQVAHLLCMQPGASGLWPWIALCAAPPRHFDEAVIDATVVAFCDAPPPQEVEYDLACRAARLLGAAQGFEVFDHARWIVRLCLAAPTPDGFHLALATSLVQGIALGRDAPARLAEITHLLLALEPDHPALLLFFQSLLPHAWLGGLPRMYIEAVDPTQIPAPLAATWAALARR